MGIMDLRSRNKIQRQNAVAWGRILPGIGGIFHEDETLWALCRLTESQYRVHFVDVLNPLVSFAYNFFRKILARDELLLATDKRLLLVRLTLEDRYAGECREILYSSIVSVSMVRLKLSRRRILRITLRDKKSIHLETTEQQPLEAITRLLRERVLQTNPGQEGSAPEHHFRCPRCGLTFHQNEAASPSCGHRFLSFRLVLLLSFLFPGLGQLYVGETMLGALYAAYQGFLVILAHEYILQWVGQLHELAYLIMGQMLINWVDSGCRAYERARVLKS